MAEQHTPEQRRAWLSALMDGDDDALAHGCAAWRDDPEARAQWHAYHLIGDVLRSDELASPPSSDAAFLQALRRKLDGEPVVLAPQAAPAVRRRRWLAPAAVAAGVAAVAGTLVVTGGLWQSPTSAPMLATAPAPSTGVLPVPAQPPAAVAGADTGKLIRDAQLDRYLRAHKQYGNSGALGLPGGVLQRASAVSPEAQAR
jgi:sigma-E factor negative regulatory protein RseA